MLPTIDMSEPMQEAIPAFVVGSDLAHWSCCTTLPMTSAALTDAFLSFSGAPFFVLVNMSTSCFRRYEGAMRESADSSTQRQRYHVLSNATLSDGDDRNFIHMKVMVDAGYPLHSRFTKTVCGGELFRSVFKGSALKMRIPLIVPTKSESSMDGDREGTASSALAPSKRWVSVPQRPDQHTASHLRCFMMPRAKFITNTSHVLPTDG
jgi:hypothetical protein